MSTKIPVIVYNGAFIVRPETGEVLHSLFFSPEEAAFVREHLEQYHISPIVYSYVDRLERLSWNTGRENEGMKHYLSNRKQDKRRRPLINEEGLYDGDVFYYTCIGKKEEMLPIYEIFSKDDRFRCTLQQELYRPEYWCEIMPQKASKAEGIRKLKEMWECDRIVSFGDAVNDIPMFEMSDECYAVENAVAELKAVATGIIGRNDQDGVARWLLEHCGEMTEP